MPQAHRRRGHVRAYRERAGMTLETLSRETGLPLDTLRKIDSGSREPLITTALRLAQALGVEVEVLFGDP
jgi:DNA-binding XRE family transcriptional regulator